MLRVASIEHDGINVRLISEGLHHRCDNTFTVIVGKNGVGKSRLLSEIAKARISSVSSAGGDVLGVHSDRTPKVIAASTSPFDKFPTPPRRKERLDKNYRYVGMRGESMYVTSSSISLLSSVTRGLLTKLVLQNNNANLIGVFDSLSFSPEFEFVFKPSFSRIKAMNATAREWQFAFGQQEVQIDTRFQSSFERMSEEDKSAVGAAIDDVISIFDKRKAFHLRVDFASNRALLDGRDVPAHLINSILMLLDLSLVRLMDIRTTKYPLGEISLRTASSGEQCLLVLMLGIAGHIEDGSLILIDEPEISLHPEWQEDFMGQLSSSFSHYRGCQFIIATHSPQITSRMKCENSFVYSLGKNELIKASEFSNKSADYQLAEIFDAPGVMNEYISRLSFNLVAKLRARSEIDAEMSLDLERLRTFKPKLEQGDPTIGLLNSVEELYKQHG